MSILTDYYCFKRIVSKSKTRLDCVASTGSYPEFEEKRATKETKATEKRDATRIGDLVCYYGKVLEKSKVNTRRKPEKGITIKGKHLTGVYVPDPSTPFGYGDVGGTADALLFVFDNMELVNGTISTGATIDMFIARGKSKDRVPLYNLLTDGELDEEISELRKRAGLLNR